MARDGTGHRVLVIFESFDLGKVIGLFGGLGFEVLVVGDIRSALLEVPTFDPDIVIMDDRSVTPREIPVLRESAHGWLFAIPSRRLQQRFKARHRNFPWSGRICS